MNDTDNYQPKGILLITGTVGSGKTIVAIDVGEQLADMGLPNAVIDLDWLGWVNVGGKFNEYDQLIMQNVISMWPNYRVIGVEYLVLARMFLQREPLDFLAKAFPNTPVTVVRLVASKKTLEKRLSQRDSGETLREHLGEMESMNNILDELKLEDAVLANEGYSVEEIAKQTIKITGWK